MFILCLFTLWAKVCDFLTESGFIKMVEVERVGCGLQNIYMA